MSRPFPAVRLRTGRIGDLGWMVHRQAVVYAKEFGYSQVFEAYLHEGTAVFLRDFDAKRDGIWVAESGESRRRSGQSILGFVAIQHDPDRRGWAKLRWFLVEREARGHGLGRRLVEAAVAFSRKAGYRGILCGPSTTCTRRGRCTRRRGSDSPSRMPSLVPGRRGATSNAGSFRCPSLEGVPA